PEARLAICCSPLSILPAISALIRKAHCAPPIKSSSAAPAISSSPWRQSAERPSSRRWSRWISFGMQRKAQNRCPMSEIRRQTSGFLVSDLRYLTSDVLRAELRPHNAGTVGRDPHRHVHATVSTRVMRQHFDMTMQPADASSVGKVERDVKREP